jgi:hypothetical protein
VGAHAALTFVADESKTIGGFGRNDRFSYIQPFVFPNHVLGSMLMRPRGQSGQLDAVEGIGPNRTFARSIRPVAGGDKASQFALAVSERLA